MLHSLRSLQNYGLSMPKLNRISVTKSISLSEFIMQCPSQWMNETHMLALIRLRYTLHFLLFKKNQFYLIHNAVEGRLVSTRTGTVTNMCSNLWNWLPLWITYFGSHKSVSVSLSNFMIKFSMRLIGLNTSYWILWLEIQKECSKMGINYISRKKMSVNLKIPSW